MNKEFRKMYKDILKMDRRILFLIALIGIALGAGGFILYQKFGYGFFTQKTVIDKVTAFVKENVSQDQATITNIRDAGNVYSFKLTIGGQEYDSYVSKDGRFLFPTGYELASKAKTGETAAVPESPVAVPKTDKPDVKVFVMSYCPYGLQMQKVFAPVYDLLKDQAEMGVYFVNYIMHGQKEMTENIRQYCIQSKAKTQYSTYLECFVQKG